MSSGTLAKEGPPRLTYSEISAPLLNRRVKRIGFLMREPNILPDNAETETEFVWAAHSPVILS